MSHKNKRYVVYTTPSPYYYRYQHLFLNDLSGTLIWQRKLCTRVNLIDDILRFYRRGDLVKFTSDIGAITYKDAYINVPKKVPTRSGIKEWDRVKVNWFCIKILRNGAEEDIYLESLLKEVNAKFETSICQHGMQGKLRKWCTPWKDQYKCKHQYEIHLNKHMDSVKT